MNGFSTTEPTPPGEGARGRLVIAMSGGVDSSAAAWLLQSEGWDLVGLFMRNGVHVAPEDVPKKSCCSEEDARDARMVAASLGIPFQAVDLAVEFGSIIQTFVDEYAAGRTPNPCAICNRDLKFDRLLALADELGAEGVATGHYARVSVQDGRVHLLRGVDPRKDQSYQMFCVREEHLARAHFPLGGMEKPRVRSIAARVGIRTAAKGDSQEICFVPSGDYRLLLEEKGVVFHPGNLLDTSGRILGRHSGTERFTIGQRRGHGIGGGTPLYVVALHPERGEVVLGGQDECMSGALELDGFNPIGIDPERGRPLRVAVQVRYHHTPAMATVSLDGPRPRVEFDEPQVAVAPGQGAAFYDGERLVGGGWITSTEAATVLGTSSA